MQVDWVEAPVHQLVLPLTKRIRFKLSSIVLLTMLAAVICIEGRWQFQQRRLERLAKKVGARIDYRPRSIAGYTWSLIIFSPRTHFVAGMQIDAYLVDSKIFSSNIVSRADLRRLLWLPASQELDSLRLRGTAVDDRIIECLSRLKGLRESSIDFTGVSRAAVERLASDLPQCKIQYGVSNGQAFLRLAHAELFALTDSIEDFALASEGDPQAVGRLLQLDCHGNEVHSETIIQGLRLATTPECLSALKSGLESSIPQVRANAIAVLASRGLLNHLVQGLHDPNLAVRLTSVRCIGNSVPKIWAARTLQEALQDDDVSVRELAIATLAKLNNDRAISVLISTAENGDPRMRLAAFEALDGAITEPARRALVRGLSDSSPAIRASAAWALRNHADTTAVDALLAASKDQASNVRSTALSALSIASGLLSQQQITTAKAADAGQEVQ